MTEKQEVRLFGIVGSPETTSVEIALKLKGVEYEYVHESPTNKSDLLLQYNPVYKKVPVLVHHEKPVCDSLVILQYVDETWKSHPILPSDPYHAALSRFWSKFIDDKVIPAIFKAALNPDEKEREKGKEEVSEALQIMENELRGKFFHGDSIGIVDIAAVYVAFWLPIIQEACGLHLFSSEKFPKLEKWSRDFLDLPYVKPTLPPREKPLAYYKNLFQSLASST
ncbi:probable glutathione S-transferase [Prosopis cineraria]|uniref:probable glutathione S-transferase n=1 Tax=Prosopis cineraria TaxID=364024 RepID=UPI00240FCC0D|nr:probable glutathione S-transferase [Prosopis cineraria]